MTTDQLEAFVQYYTDMWNEGNISIDNLIRLVLDTAYTDCLIEDEGCNG